MLQSLSSGKSIIAAGILLLLYFSFSASTLNTVSALSEPKILLGHTDSVSSIAVSLNGRVIASASLDNTVRLWDTQTGNLIRVLNGHKTEVYAVAFSTDGKKIASSDYDGKILIWSVESGKLIRTLQIKGWSTAIAFSPDGKQLAVANQEPTTIIFEVETGNVLRSLETSGNTNVITFSPDNRYIATATSAIALWNFQTGKIDKLLKGHQRLVKSITFSNDGRFLASGSSDKTARIWNVETGETEKTFQTVTPIRVKYSSKPLEWKMPVIGVAFSPDGKTLAAATGRSVHLWEITTGKNFQTLEGHEHSVTSVCFLPDGKSIVSGSLDNTVRIW